MSAPSLHLGRDREQWLQGLQARAERLFRLLELNAPPFLISNETDLIRQALDAIDELAGDRATSAAIREELAEIGERTRTEQMFGWSEAT